MSGERQERLSAIRQRCEAATEGPWSWENAESECGGACTPSGCLGHETDIPESLYPVGARCENVFENQCATPADRGQWQADAAFIEHARADVPWLLAQIEELSSALRSAREDSARLDWIEAHGQQASLHCWNVMPHSHVGHDNGWTLGSDEELDDIGRGRTARMAIDDAMRHPERLLVSLPQPERDDA